MRIPTGRSGGLGGIVVIVIIFVVLMALTLFCFGLIMPNFNALAMEPMGRIAGTASSFYGAVTTAIVNPRIVHFRSIIFPFEIS